MYNNHEDTAALMAALAIGFSVSGLIFLLVIPVIGIALVLFGGMLAFSLAIFVFLECMRG